MLLTIEKLIYGGDGLARLPVDSSSGQDRARGKAVFVPFTLAGEKVEATITEEKPGFARAKVDQIVQPSPQRVAPRCPYFARCGGCHYQHASYEHQIEIKKEILRENLRRIAKLELQCEIQVHPSPPWNYRNRSRLQVRTNPQFAAGYFRLGSHEVLAVEECPISSPLVNRGIAALWKLGRAGAVPSGVREVEFFADADDTRLLVEISCGADAKRAALKALVEELTRVLHEVAGVTVVRDPQPGEKNETAGILLTHGDSALNYRAGRANYRVSTGAFFQTNRNLIDELVQIVVAGQSGDLAVDLYAGVGLFSTALARDFHHIVSVESSQTAAADLAYNLPPNGEAIRATTEQYLTGSGKGQQPRAGGGDKVRSEPRQKPDLVVVDPPRSGLGERVARSLAELGAPRVTYVSCDPATLARDLVILRAAGYRLEQIHLVDLFPQTYHLESVAQLGR